jgi:hypothetical protein
VRRPWRSIFVVVTQIEHVLEGVIVESPGKEEMVFKKVIKIFSDYEMKPRNFVSERKSYDFLTPLTPKIENAGSLYAAHRRTHTNKHNSIALQNKRSKRY